MPFKSGKQELLEFCAMIQIHDILEAKETHKLLSDDDNFDLCMSICFHRYSMPRSLVPKSDGWLQSVLFNNEFGRRFRQHLRMNRDSFSLLYDLIKDHEVFLNSKSTLRIQLAIALNQLGSFGSSASVGVIASKFGYSEGAVVACTNRVVTVLNNSNNLLIRWPNEQERKLIGSRMAQNFLPNCVGFVDGSSAVLFQAPLDNKEVYWSRKKHYSIQFQIVCDDNKLIRSFTTGYPGSVHDAKVYHSCRLYTEPNNYFGDGEYIIGDSAYGISETVLVPFKRRHGILEIHKRRYNRHVAGQRVKVEHAIGILKGRFQCLLGLRVRVNLETGHLKACQWIHACILLHNFLMLRDPWNQPGDTVLQDVIIPEANDIQINDLNEDIKGQLKRSALCEIVNTMYR